MNSDDAGEWLTYVDAGQRLGISTAAARQLSRRRNWPRRTPNEYGAQALVWVPAEALQRSLKPHTDPVRMGDGVRDTSDAAFVLLAHQLEREQGRADRAERHLEAERDRVEKLRGMLDRQNLALADAVAAERIAAGEASGLRAELEARRNWGLMKRLRWALSKRQ